VIADTECRFEVPTGEARIVPDRGCLNLWMASISRRP
jgi:hypothetical protein